MGEYPYGQLHNLWGTFILDNGFVEQTVGRGRNSQGLFITPPVDFHMVVCEQELRLKSPVFYDFTFVISIVEPKFPICIGCDPSCAQCLAVHGISVHPELAFAVVVGK